MYKVGDRLKVLVDEPAAAMLNKGDIVTVVSVDETYDSFDVVSADDPNEEWSLRDEHVQRIGARPLEDGELLAVISSTASHHYPLGLLVRVTPDFNAHAGVYLASPVYSNTPLAQEHESQYVPADEFITVITGSEEPEDV
jgi:hypothetical protein